MTTLALKDIEHSSEVSYSGIRFGVLRNFEINGEFVYDEADRSVTHVRYMIHLWAIICSSDVDDQNGNMESLHKALSKAGGKLVIKNVGFDDGVDTAVGGRTPDVLWGAKPRSIRCKSLGHVAWEVTWSCEFNVSRCTGVGVTTGDYLMAFNYSSAYSARNGLMTRVIQGYAQVPAVRGAGGNKTMPFNIGERWDRIDVSVPDGFRRVDATHEVNAAKNRIDFAIVDEELKGPALPQGVVEGDLTYRYESTGVGFQSWAATLSGRLTVAPGYPKSLAGRKFFEAAFGKMKQLNSLAAATSDGMVIPRRLSIEEDCFTLTTGFSISWTVIACLHDVLQRSGIWSPLPDSDYRRWATSMRKVWGNRGVSGLAFNASDDIIIDLCTNASGVSIGNDRGRLRQANGSYREELLCPDVTKERSYVSYINKLRMIESENVVVHRHAVEYKPGQSTSGEAQTLQYQGDPDRLVYMAGRGLRLGFKPEVPDLVSVGGFRATRVKAHVVVDDIPTDSFFDCPLYKAEWGILYRVHGRPANKAPEFTGSRPAPAICGAAGKQKAGKPPKKKPNPGMYGPPWFQL